MSICGGRGLRGRLLAALGCDRAALALLGPATSAQQGVTTSYGYAVFGELKYGPGFEHFDYVNPDAPKGGAFRVATQGRRSTASTRSRCSARSRRTCCS